MKNDTHSRGKITRRDIGRRRRRRNAGARRRSRLGAALPAGGAAHQGAGGVPRSRSARHRRGLRQRRLCLQLEDHRRAAGLQQPHRALGASASPSASNTAPAEIERVDIYKTKRPNAPVHDLHPWRQLARRPRRAVHRLCRAVREGGREFRGGRFHQCAARPAATSSRWSTSAAARSPGPSATPRALAAMPTRSI